MAENSIISDIPDMMHCQINGQAHQYYLVAPDEYWHLRHVALVYNSIISKQKKEMYIPEYIDAREVEKFFHFPKSKMIKAAQKRKIHVYGPGKRMLFKTDEVKALLALNDFNFD